MITAASLNRSFTISSDSLGTINGLDTGSMAQARLKADPFHDGNVYTFPRAAYAPDEATAALDLVYQAADVFRSQQERAHDTEARAHALCRAAAEKLKLAERRAEAAEQALRDVMATVDQKLKDASTALELAQSRVSAQADQVAAAEFRTQTALAETREAKKALVLVEEAIRRRLLTVSSLDGHGQHAVA